VHDNTGILLSTLDMTSNERSLSELLFTLLRRSRLRSCWLLPSLHNDAECRKVTVAEHEVNGCSTACKSSQPRHFTTFSQTH